MKSLAITLFGLALGTLTYASEVDSFHNRYRPLEDSLEKINNKTNELLQTAVNEANSTFFGCSERFLYWNMRRYFGNKVTSKFPGWLMSENTEIDKIITPVEESIYQDFDWRAPIQGVWAQRVSDPTGYIFNVSGHIIGSDKFEHFFGSGYRYFRTYHQKNNPIEEALEIGWKAETGLMGAWTTGVMAYADMVANFQGMRFWNHILAENIDIFGPEKKHNPGPYVRCEGRQWEVVKKIDFRDYIDHAWDEGINCSKFNNNQMTNSVISHINRLEEKYNRRLQCPIYPEKLEEVLEKYTPFQPWLVNEHGHQTVRDHRDWPIVLE